MILTKAYIVRLSGNIEIKIDQDELMKVVSGIHGKQSIVVRNGMINPSFYIGIVADEKRIENWLDDLKYLDPSEKARRRMNGMEPLKNIFEGTEVGNRMMGFEHNQKQLA